MRVLGIDPGSRFLGWGAVEERIGQPTHVDHGVVRMDGAAPLELRLQHLFTELSQILRRYRPAELAVEGVFTLRNARSALVLGHARGVVLLAAAQAGITVHEYAPAKVKKAVGAGGGADKEAVARMVKTFLKIESFERSDASDALAVALCHLNRSRAPKLSRSTDAGWRARLAPAYRRFGV